MPDLTGAKIALAFSYFSEMPVLLNFPGFIVIIK